MQPEQLPPTDAESVPIDPDLPITDPQARKRVEIGLSPRRPTARETVQRPPRLLLARWQQWAIAGLVLLLMVATVLLIVAQSTGAAMTWPQVRGQWRAWLTGQSTPELPTLAAPTADYQLRVQDTFGTKSGLLACTQQAGQWATDVVAERGIYQFHLWPGRLVWSTLALTDLTPYWLEASFTIVDVMPEGYTGILGRYVDAETFYLFVIDGAARYQVLLWQAGVLTTLQSWTASPVLNPAGYENVLALEDDGQTLQFYANRQRLFAVDAPVLPPGATGLVGGAGERTMAEITVDWLRLYERIQ